MKKLITLTCLLGLFAASNASAKTEGNYVGLDLIISKEKTKMTTAAGIDNYGNNSQKAFGINYKHAFSVGNNVFVAPGVFFDKLSFNNDDAQFSYRYGAKFDIGYDINDQFAIYFTNGVANNRYQYSYSVDDEEFSRNANKAAYFYGLGLSYTPIKDVSFNVEYSTQKTSLKAGAGAENDTRLNLVKVGVAYHF